MRLHLRLVSAITAVLAITGGCDGSQDPSSLRVCPDSVTVSVSSPSAPRIAWTPACRANRVLVDHSDFFDDWVLGTVGDTNGLYPPVHYGVSPAGSVVLINAAALQSGRLYRVRILRATGDTALPYTVVGGTYFTP